MNNEQVVRKTKSRKWLLLAAGLIVLILLVLVPSFNNLYIVVLFITILSYVILTVAWTLFSGPTGYISLAPAAFFGLGMYAAAIFGKDVPFTAVIFIAAALSFLFALLVGAVTLRLRGIYFTIFTFGLVFLIQQVLTWWELEFTHTRGRFVAGAPNEAIYYHMLAIFVVLFALAILIRRSKFGLALQSIGQNEDAAAHAGVNVTILKVITFAISALFMGAAGAALASRVTYIDPGSAFNITYSFFPVLMAIFGGPTSLYGSIAGAIAFSYLEEYLTTHFPYYYMMTFGAIMVAVITFLPNGLVGLAQRFRRGGLAKTNAHT